MVASPGTGRVSRQYHQRLNAIAPAATAHITSRRHRARPPRDAPRGAGAVVSRHGASAWASIVGSEAVVTWGWLPRRRLAGTLSPDLTSAPTARQRSEDRGGCRARPGDARR